jgi:transcriptional regulator with XRE-family HTH domain
MTTLAQARRRKLLTQRQLAHELGVRPALVSAWERGVDQPRREDLRKLCLVLEVPPEEIEITCRPEDPGNSREAVRQQIAAHDESMGYVDSTWLRGGRYDVDSASHETPA